ncbi:xanthine dehydrogenase family protein molybdopterin-binding subunit [bacterium]|nr:MAG: xanthine dehydrogenase family protein molybdopterin-binding subunit [bacterium]
MSTRVDPQPITEDRPTVQIGRSIPRLESLEKVTGETEYIHHLRLPHMLYGKIFRSSVAHGRILKLDTRAARELPGVAAVITGADVCALIPEPYYGPAFHDQPVLAIDKVRYVGEPVAVALSEDPHLAEHAANLIEAEYEELPAVFDEVEAAAATDTFVHDALKPAGTFPDLKHLQGRTKTNVALDFSLRHNDAERGFEQADYIFEHVFRTPAAIHAAMEPIVAVGEPRGSSAVTIHTSSQSPSFVRTEVARLLGWPENHVRVRTAFLGGGFGAKLYIKLEALVAVLALLVKRPVKIALTMEEQFYTITKHATTVRMKSGVTKAGKVVARRCEAWWNGGAYADIGPRVTQKSGFTAAGPYDIENVSLDSYAVYTNLPPAGAFRGFGIPQLVWAYESHTDIIARELELDPLEFRRANILRNGRPQATGTIMRDTATVEVLDTLERAMDWKAPRDPGDGNVRRGRGVAIGFKACIAPTTSVAIVNIYGDGSCAVYCGTVDMGQGSDTAMAQIAAEVLGLDPRAISVIHPDTDVTPYDMATLGSRSTFHMGNAVRLAALDAREKLFIMAGKALGCDPGLLSAAGGCVRAPDGRQLSVGEVIKSGFLMQAGNLIGSGSFRPTYTSPSHGDGQSSDITPFWMVGAVGADVEVDMETGHVRVTRLVSVADVGTVINPAIVTRQLNGGAVMQLGLTMSEALRFDHGQVTNASLADYKIPGILDVPAEIFAEAAPGCQHSGPFGAKGAGETGTFAVSPAIANAIHDATGVRIYDLPLTPEVVYRALRAAQHNPLENEL